MDLNEQLFAIAKAITGSTVVKFGEVELDFGKMTRLSMRKPSSSLGLQVLGRRLRRRFGEGRRTARGDGAI